MSEAGFAPLATEDADEPHGLLLQTGDRSDDSDDAEAARRLVAQKNAELAQISEQMQKMQQQSSEQMQRMEEQIAALTPRPGSAVGDVQRGSVSGPMEGYVSKHELDAALAEHKAENAKLRQVVSSAKAAGGEANILRVLSTAEDSLLLADDDDSATQSSGPSDFRPAA